MKSNYLLPYRFKFIGWAILIPAFVMAFIYIFITTEIPFLDCNVFAFSDLEIFSKHKIFKVIDNNLTDEITAFSLLLGALFVAFSKEKYEDEFIAKIRLDSLLWATYINYIVLLLTIFFLYGFSFFWVLVSNMFTILFVFIIRFNLMLYKLKKQNKDEE